MPERRDDRAQRIHPVHWREAAHQTDDRLRERSRGGELRLEVPELCPRRQTTMPQEVTDLLERGIAGEVVDVVPAVRKDAFVAVNETDGRGCGDDVFEATLGFGVSYRHRED